MSVKYLFSLSFLLITFQLISQENYFSSLTIDDDLKTNANAVVRYDDIHINIEAYNKMVYTNKRIVTILNKEGDNKVGAYQHYNKNIQIQRIEAKIYNAYGKEIKKFKKKDFDDVSAVSGGTLYSDNRVKYLRYTPINYPYTVVFETEVEYRTTAFIPGWRIIEGFYTSTQNAEYRITNNSDTEIKIKVSNFEDFNIKKLKEFHYLATNIEAIRPEQYSPAFKTYAPMLKATLTKFEMEGVTGTNTNWSDFGNWMNSKLLFDTQVLPQEVKDEIKALTANAKTDIEKAKIVYNYVQDKTRYISVQVGIGGWKPMLAEDVDRLGYGDCKGLSNYTKALLNEVGVESYYTIIYGDDDIQNIDESFSSMQGNHAILCLPNNSDFVWLECTSQTNPFGYIANFTDDRDALIVTPEGGKIAHTKSYMTAENVLRTKAEINLDIEGSIEAAVNSNALGSQYAYHERLQRETEKETKLHYKEYWNYINNLTINQFDFTNNKDDIIFTENVKLLAEKYASKTGNRLLLSPNVFNRIQDAPKRYAKRKLPFEIERGFTDIDEYKIVIPSTLEVEAMMKPISITNKFGEYTASVETLENNLVYNRKLILNKGVYLKEDYKAFREFWLQIIKYDKSKIVLKTKE